MSSSSTIMSDHVRKAVWPYIQEDLRDYMQSVPIDAWVEAVLGLDSQLLQSWADTAREWIDDAVIHAAMDTFRAAPSEKPRYAPFCSIANRILTLGKEQLKVPAEAGRSPTDTDPLVSYPISDIGFYRLDPDHVTTGHRESVPLDGKDAQRSPDTACMRASSYVASGTKPRWAELLFTCELKGPRAPQKKNTVKSPLASSSVSVSKSNPQQTAPAADPPRLGKRKARRDDEDGEDEGENENDGEDADGEDEDGDDTGDGTPPAKRRQTSYKGYKHALNPDEYEGTIQAANNTLESSTYSGGSRIHHIQLLLDDYRLLFFYFDASGMVKSQESWHFFRDFGKVAAALVALARCDVNRLGAFPHMNPPANTPYPSSFPPLDLEQFSFVLNNENSNRPVKLTLAKLIFSQYISIGRRTFVYDVKMDLGPAATRSKAMIVKVAQQVVTRTAEWELIEAARAKGVEHIPEIHAYGQLHDLRNDAGPRKDLHDIFGALDSGLNYENRVVRAMVCTKYTTLEARLAEVPEDVMIMTEQMVKCLHDLRYKASVLHRDVSLANIVCEINEGQPPRFILNDFDLACHLDESGEPKGASSNHRTGTLPFVAIDLLYDVGTLSVKDASRNPPLTTHRLRHDFESLFWTVLWGIMVSQRNKVSAEQWSNVVAELVQWENGPLPTLYRHKAAIIANPNELVLFPLPPVFASGLPLLWLDAFREVFAAQVPRLAEKRKTLLKQGGGDMKRVRLTEAELDSMINKETILKALNAATAPSIV